MQHLSSYQHQDYVTEWEMGVMVPAAWSSSGAALFSHQDVNPLKKENPQNCTLDGNSTFS